jgi:hypothetical protein
LTCPLTAAPATALRAADRPIPVASHIGARTRLARAQARAGALDAAAQELETSAADERRLADECRQQRDALRTEGRSFPPLSSSRFRNGTAGLRAGHGCSPLSNG